MVKLKIKYTEIDFTNENQQAAGFAPFTRGYKTHTFSTAVINDISCDVKFEYTLPTFSTTDMIVLAQKIILDWKRLETKKEINLKVPTLETLSEIIYIRVLRTLLSIICKTIANDPTLLKFKFISFSDSTNLLALTYNYSNFAQIDQLVLSHPDYLKFNTLKAYINADNPIDCLYGSKEIEKKTNILFSDIYSKLSIC